MRDLVEALRAHWPEYVMEAAGLGLFMVSAAVVTTALEYPPDAVKSFLGPERPSGMGWKCRSDRG